MPDNTIQVVDLIKLLNNDQEENLKVEKAYHFTTKNEGYDYFVKRKQQPYVFQLYKANHEPMDKEESIYFVEQYFLPFINSRNQDYFYEYITQLNMDRDTMDIHLIQSKEVVRQVAKVKK